MRVTILLTLCLTACASEGDKAAQRYDNTRSAGGSAHARCQRANEAVHAYLGEGDKNNVDKWAATARADCTQSRLIGSVGF